MWDERFDKLDALLADCSRPDAEGGAAARRGAVARGSCISCGSSTCAGDLVFGYMTDPDHLSHFWGPAGAGPPGDA